MGRGDMGMTKRGKLTMKPMTETERLAEAARQRAANDMATAPLVPLAAQQHDQYEPHGKYGDARKAMINRGGTPVRRWITAGLLSETQQAAIAHCVRMWGIIGSSGALTCNLGRPPSGGGYGEGHPREVEARDDLARIRAYVPGRYYDVFENVCRFDEPAGVAGSRLDVPSESASVSARLIVQFVADTIYMRERLSY